MKKSLGLVLVGVLAVNGVAMGALNAAHAWNGWYGVTNMTNGSDVDANVEWLVRWTGTEFEYSYQVTVLGTQDIGKVAVVMIPSNEATGLGSAQIDAGDVAPSSEGFAGSGELLIAAEWFWDSGLSTGDTTYELYYTSVNAPQNGTGYVVDGTLAFGTVPTPSNEIPEPATLTALALSGLALLSRRRR